MSKPEEKLLEEETSSGTRLRREPVLICVTPDSAIIYIYKKLYIIIESCSAACWKDVQNKHQFLISVEI